MVFLISRLYVYNIEDLAEAVADFCRIWHTLAHVFVVMALAGNTSEVVTTNLTRTSKKLYQLYVVPIPEQIRP